MVPFRKNETISVQLLSHSSDICIWCDEARDMYDEIM